jgi:hypothetical protein
MGKLKAATVILMITVFFTAAGSAVAQDSNAKKLSDMEDQLHEEQQKNEEAKQAIVKLEKKVQCTYKLVKGYESCDATFPEKNAGYLECIEKARKEKDDCLQELSAESE